VPDQAQVNAGSFHAVVLAVARDAPQTPWRKPGSSQRWMC
jgi:hypothetical protein